MDARSVYSNSSHAGGRAGSVRSAAHQGPGNTNGYYGELDNSDTQCVRSRHTNYGPGYNDARGNTDARSLRSFETNTGGPAVYTPDISYRYVPANGHSNNDARSEYSPSVSGSTTSGSSSIRSGTTMRTISYSSAPGTNASQYNDNPGPGVKQYGSSEDANYPINLGPDAYARRAEVASWAGSVHSAYEDDAASVGTSKRRPLRQHGAQRKIHDIQQKWVQKESQGYQFPGKQLEVGQRWKSPRICHATGVGKDQLPWQFQPAEQVTDRAMGGGGSHYVEGWMVGTTWLLTAITRSIVQVNESAGDRCRNETNGWRIV
ncbi:hypothetical protein B0T19DRAFT_404933 [Cercophora scortea]|uniref:Uncharacterized protein n=1 Tax=Cercophora scortea TaxID=314031 RepID=A0AAE0M448_9PEZI|nr:hypothetical protein B0T19DRAFT_404933 [Cercophora scortea]